MNILEFNINAGGPLVLLKNLFNNIHLSDSTQIDIAALNEFENKNDYSYFNKFGINCFFLGTNGNLFSKRIKRIRGLIQINKRNKYDIIHIHSDAAGILFLYGIIARIISIPKIIFHSHSTNICGKNLFIRCLIHYIFRPFLTFIGTDFLACSEEAGKWMYSNVKNLKIIKNGIDLNKFKVNDSIRKQYQEKLKYSADDKVIGHVGRFSDEKNHRFIIDLFYELTKESEKYKLLLLGDGELRSEIEEYAKQKGVFENIIFTGNVNNVQDYMQAMDLFILPSKFEGLPLTGVEAQACGLPVIFSINVTTETKITENVKFISLDDMESWKTETSKMITLSKTNNTNIIIDAGYNIQKTAEEIKKIYME